METMELDRQTTEALRRDAQATRDWMVELNRAMAEGEPLPEPDDPRFDPNQSKYDA